MPRPTEPPIAPAPPAPSRAEALEYEALARALAAGLAGLWRAKHRAGPAQGEPLAAPAPPVRASPAA